MLNYINAQMLQSMYVCMLCVYELIRYFCVLVSMTGMVLNDPDHSPRFRMIQRMIRIILNFTMLVYWRMIQMIQE